MPLGADDEIVLSFGGYKYSFHLTYNTTNLRYYLDISRNEKRIISGLKLVENVNISGKYDLPDFDHGFISVIKANATDDMATRDNIGVGKPYSLLYVPYVTDEGGSGG